MAKIRLGDDWRCGMQVQYWSTWQQRPRVGTITGRAYGRNQRREAIFFLEIDAGHDGPREVVAWDQVTWPDEESTAVIAAIDGKRHPARELGRHHGRAYVEYRPDGAKFAVRVWIDDVAVEPSLTSAGSQAPR